MTILYLLKTNKKEEKKLPALNESNLSLQDLNSLYDKHVSYVSFRKDNRLLTEDKKALILRNIEEVYEMITNTHGNKKRSRDENIDTDVIVTNSNSNVS